MAFASASWCSTQTLSSYAPSTLKSERILNFTWAPWFILLLTDISFFLLCLHLVLLSYYLLLFCIWFWLFYLLPQMPHIKHYNAGTTKTGIARILRLSDTNASISIKIVSRNYHSHIEMNVCARVHGAIMLAVFMYWTSIKMVISHHKNWQ